MSNRLRTIREWRERFEVGAIDEQREDLVDTTGKVAVFQHTLDDYDYLLDLVDRAEVAARETVMALDGVEMTWDHMPQPPTYGRGLSRWDGPTLLKRLLNEIHGKEIYSGA